MIQASNVTLQFGKRILYENVNIQFDKGNCYGIIGANGAGKSQFLKILSGELQPNSGEVIVTPGERISVLRQDHFLYDEFDVLTTVIMGNKRLYEVMQEKDALYSKPDFSDEDGIRAAELEGEFAEMDGWDAESSAQSMLNQLGITEDLHYKKMAELDGNDKVKVLLAQALFGNPDILLLDEPTNHLDMDSREVLEDALADFPGTILAISHDRYFINRFANRVCVLEEGGVKEYLGNYDDYFEKINRAMEPDGALPQMTRTAQEKEKRRSREEERRVKERRQALERAEAAVARAEEEAAELEAALADPATYQDAERAARLAKEYQQKKDEIDRLYQAWEALEAEE